MNKESSHILKVSIAYLEGKNINYILVPGGMTSVNQPLNIYVKKIFKDNVKYLFEKDPFFGWFKNQINPKQARLNLIVYIYRVWSNDMIISKDIIVNGYKKAGIIDIFYTAAEEDNINK